MIPTLEQLMPPWICFANPAPSLNFKEVWYLSFPRITIRFPGSPPSGKRAFFFPQKLLLGSQNDDEPCWEARWLANEGEGGMANNRRSKITTNTLYSIERTQKNIMELYTLTVFILENAQWPMRKIPWYGQSICINWQNACLALCFQTAIAC